VTESDAVFARMFKVLEASLTLGLITEQRDKDVSFSSFVLMLLKVT
jgi:hypothetical protein